MSLEALRNEFEAEHVGPQIYGAIRRLVAATARRYRPDVYAEHAAPDGRWTPDLIEDLVQSFFADALLGQSQLRYALDAAHDLPSFERIIVAQVRRHLRHRRRRTVIDNLLERARALLEAG
jgi:hypothetical protein